MARHGPTLHDQTPADNLLGRVPPSPQEPGPPAERGLAGVGSVPGAHAESHLHPIFRVHVFFGGSWLYFVPHERASDTKVRRFVPDVNTFAGGCYRFVIKHTRTLPEWSMRRNAEPAFLAQTGGFSGVKWSESARREVKELYRFRLSKNGGSTGRPWSSERGIARLRGLVYTISKHPFSIFLATP